jgi:hypothetical protein
MARGNTTVKDGAGLGSPNFRSWHEPDQPDSGGQVVKTTRMTQLRHPRDL